MLNTLLSVDCGIRGAGAALFLDRQLYAATLITSRESGNGARACAVMAHDITLWVRGMLYRIQPAPEPASLLREYAVEWPQIYVTRIREGREQRDPNDLIALAGVGAAVAALLPLAVCTHYLPATWKGQVPKGVMLKRIEGRLSEAERARIERAGAKTHNIIDAIGIGLHHLGRLEPERVIAR